MRNKLKFVFLIVLLGTVFHSFSFSQEVIVTKPTLISRDVHFAQADDIVIRGVFNDYDYWFLIPQFVDLEQATLVLNLSHAEELIPDLANMTVFLNGTPIESVFLTPRNSDNYKLSINLPQERIFAGFNYLRFSFFMRSTTVPCADVDNPVNWSVLHADSVLRFKFRLSEAISLGSFQQAFSGAGVLFSDDIAFILDKDLDDGFLEAASIISNFLGSKSIEPKNIRVFYEGNVSADILSNYNIIVIGKPEKLPLLAQLSKTASLSDLPTSLSNIQQGEALAFLASSAWAADKFVFGVVGTNTKDIKRAALHIADGNLDNITSNIAVLKDMLLEDVKAYSPKKLPSKITLKDLGYSDRVVKGIFSRSTSFKFRRPYNWKLKPNSKLNLLTSFSSFIKPHTSALAVEINGVPVGSSRLFGNPDKPLLVSVNIPRENLDDRDFFISANFYLDIGQKDCDHLQGEKAWGVIKSDSNFFLPHSFKRDKDFSDFPSMLMRADELMPTIILVPDKPAEDDLSFALTISAIIGSALQQELTFPRIKKSSLMDEADKNNNIMIVGWPDDFRWYSQINDYLPLNFDKEKGIFDIEEVITDLDYPLSYLVMQMCSSPWSKERTVSLFSAKDNGYALLREIFTDPMMHENIKGNLIYADALDNVLSYNLKPKLEVDFPDNTYTISLIILGIVFLLCVVLALVYLRRRKIRNKS